MNQPAIPQQPDETFVGVTGVGYELGDTLLTNDDISAIIKQNVIKRKGSDKLTDEEVKALLTNDEWIRTMTGIATRYWHKSGATSDLAAKAIHKAVQNAGRSGELEFIITATVSPDHLYSPTVSCLVHAKLGVAVRNALGYHSCLPIDVGLACSSFGAALMVGYSFIRSGLFSYGVVVGADKMSSTVDHGDRNFMPLMGDAAAAFVLERVDQKRDSFPWGAQGFLPGVDTSGVMNIIARAGGSAEPIALESMQTAATTPGVLQPGKLWQDGHKVMRHMSPVLPQVIKQLCRQAKLNLSAISYIFPHQANLRIIKEVQSRMPKQSRKKFFTTIARFANTTSASVPLGVAIAVEEEKLRPGMVILLAPFGAGYSFVPILMKWTANQP